MTSWTGGHAGSPHEDKILGRQNKVTHSPPPARQAAAALEPTGLRATQMSVLVALSLAERAPLSRVADGLVMDRTTLTRNLRPLERRGWVRIEAGEDRRERTLGLTDSGRAALDRALPLWQQAQASVLARIGDARWAGLLTDLQGLISTAREATPADKRN